VIDGEGNVEELQDLIASDQRARPKSAPSSNAGGGSCVVSVGCDVT